MDRSIGNDANRRRSVGGCLESDGAANERTKTQTMNVTLSLLENELERKRIEIAELEIAIRVLRLIEGKVEGKKDLSEKTIMECAEIILSEKGTMLYRDVAEEALRRGYSSQKGGNAATVTRSFWATMNRAKDRLKSNGGGRYSLRSNPCPDETAALPSASTPTQADTASS